MSPENSSKERFNQILIILIILLVVVNMYRGLTVQKIGIPGIFEIEFGQPNPPDPGPDDNHDIHPPEVMDFSGVWQTNQPGLEYVIEQNGEEFIWHIPGAESGPGRIEESNIFPEINGRPVHFFVIEEHPPGNPIRLGTEDPQFRELILFR
jgi:hypothetical protein